MKPALLFILTLLPLTAAEYFTPTHQLSGIGVSRDDLSDSLIEVRSSLMVESQTFAILRDPESLPGAKRITSNARLQAIFRQAADRSGLPASLIEAIAYLESWGDPKAESPSGPRGIMQIAAATARGMGLKIMRTTKYRTVVEKVQVRDKRKRRLVTRTVRRKMPYEVLVRDDRLVPELAIPAAANYLANLERRYGGRDWAVFAYHCGEGCVAEMMDLTRRARGIPKDQITVPRMFFSSSPAWNRELYQAVQLQMQRDYSPTYWFRIQRAEQLLSLYRRDPDAFETMAQEFRSDSYTTPRAPHRLSVWLKRDDMIYQTAADIQAGMGSALVRAPNRPDYLGYALRLDPDESDREAYLSEATPSAIGTLAYIAFETRRLWEALNPRGDQFRPLEVSALVAPEEFMARGAVPERLAHRSGQVFDIAYGGLPPSEYECLRFVLEDLGWEGYLGFVEEGRNSLHIGCAPSAREFFTTVYQEAQVQLANQMEGGKSTGVRQNTHVGELH